ncbi:hypothetical protein [Facklamia sp. P13055]|uniref:hypothetical protein n=1 Tax=Facklamia sp. P13055 TaxID=3421952 RepID=UPI003D185310
MKEEIKKLIGIEGIEDGYGNNLSINYKDSWLHKIVIPFTFLLCLIDLSLLKEMVLNIFPEIFIKGLYFVLILIFNLGEFVYSNFTCITFVLLLLAFLIAFLGYSGIFYKDIFYKHDIVLRNGKVKSWNFISAWKRLVYIFWLLLTDFYILYYFSIISVNSNSSTISLLQYNKIFFFIYCINLFIFFLEKIFTITIPERYGDLKADEVIACERYFYFNRYSILLKHSGEEHEDESYNNKTSYIYYIIKDNYVDISKFLFVKIKRIKIKADNEKINHIISEVYISENLDEVKYKFEESIK